MLFLVSRQHLIQCQQLNGGWIYGLKICRWKPNIHIQALTCARAPCPNTALWKLVCLRAQNYKHFCFHYTIDHLVLQSHRMDSLTTVMQTTPINTTKVISNIYKYIYKKYTSIQGRCVEDGKVQLAIRSPPPSTQTQKHTWSV